MKKYQYIAVLIFMLLTQPIFAETRIELAPGAPPVYTVQPGDTLIGIAERYLKDPSEWPFLLKNNPQVSNPYRLYPGEILTLDIEGGHPRIHVSEGGTIKLSPQIRSYPLNKPIPIIPLIVIKPFLNAALVVNKGQLQSAPYIVALAEEHTTVGAGDQIYVMGIPPMSKVDTEFAIFRQGKEYKDPITRQSLGYEAVNVGFAQLQQNGRPSTLLVTQTTREVLTGDNLLPSSTAQFDTDFYPSAPKTQITGQIISVLDGVTQIGQYDVVVIDRGRRNGLAVGNILDVYQLGQTVADPVKKQQVKLPNERAGQLLVFRVFDQVSYGVLLVATSPMHVLDLVVNPESEQ
ncbi:MAG: LysM peptidoglycan-binding domain-containing protein [Gammaproteobacteria bacterium]|nr:LysM peptidoglycan-binding domain-containing protein [Gammaproteobacteria bacterium]